MGGRGGACRAWEEDIYWNHFQFICFTQFLRSDFDQQLALPKTFSDNIKNLPESVTLKGPGGVLWNIELTTRDNTLYFAHGWQQFVKEHSLKENDFLVFKYNGGSLFEVLIFDGESLCEKAACYFVRKCQHAANTEQGVGCSSKKRDSDNSVEEVKTPNGVDEGVSPVQSFHLNSNRVPLAVPIETTNGKTPAVPIETTNGQTPAVPIETTNGKTPAEPIETTNGKTPAEPIETTNGKTPAEPIETTNGKTSNAGVETASAEQFMSDAVTDTEPKEPKTVPSQTTGKRTRRRPVYADMSVPSKKRGRPPKTANSHEGPPKTANSHEGALNSVSGAELIPKVSPKASPKVGLGTKELYTSNRRPVTKNEIENTLQLAKATCAEDTLLVTMRPTHVYKRFFVSFHNKWIINHLSPSSQDVILRIGKSEWLGKYLYHKSRNNGGLAGGWKYFALENNLEEFDVCVFKPAGYMDKTLILDVTIFRVVEEVTPLTAVNSPGKNMSIKKTPTRVNSLGKKRSIKKTTTGVNSSRKRRSIKKTPTEVNSPGKKSKKTPTGVNSPGKKRSIKNTPTGAVQTELESSEPLVKKRGVNITLTSAVQTELDSIEGV
ncbi:B3 domain-containing protein Os02g0598200 isoform X4 [Lathyrus oleraceus]|uniref:B3 domain-containing protein Os02g0598200 isoform X4 n=1 Tax=Pisum sativum TaxID=3888 RepID=UPI0021CF9EA4|nr:B3 domain-containing protein Os02g0598200-like isoform X4 [Pisum sativum]